MLGKLIKYEFKASYRLFLLLYAALLVVSLINMGFDPLESIVNRDTFGGSIMSLLQAIFMFSYIVLVFAVAIVTIVVIIMRFYKNLLGDEGYLMFTLPVETDSQIMSKIIVSTIWSILSTIAVLLSILIITIRLEWLDEIKYAYTESKTYGIDLNLWTAGIIITILIYMICSIVMFYASMAVGSNLTKNRLLGSFLGYIILYAISQVVGTIGLIWVYFSGALDMVNALENEAVSNDMIIEYTNSLGLSMFIFVNVIEILLLVGYYFTTRYFIKNKLNLS